MPESITLRGCTPEPLSNYLKALGVLRLLAEPHYRDQDKKLKAIDPQAKGYWRNDVFVLITHLTSDELEKFFLYHYEPTPLVAPWNGSTGFYPKDTAQKRLLNSIQQAKSERFQLYGEAIAIAQQQVDALKLTVQPKDEEKRRLVERLRNHLPDEVVKWLDTCLLITSDLLETPPLLGTGGNEGNVEYSRTFMQQLQELIDLTTGKPTQSSNFLLKAALFDEILPELPFAGKIGQFNPIATGGVNASPRHDTDSRVNPWSYVLTMEGIMLFASGATRRYEKSERGRFVYPFTVNASSIGYGSASDSDVARAEFWVPLWSQPTGLRELQILFSEGRAKVGGRSVRDGIDFARAISSLGVTRGIQEFVRYIFLQRNGAGEKASHFAIPLDRFQPQFNPQVDRLKEIDNWLDSFRRAAQDDKAPASVKRAHRRLETAIIDFSRGKAFLLDVLIALGEAEAALDNSLKFTQKKCLHPLPLLESGWIDDCKEESSEFRLALALASNNLRQRLARVRGNKPTFGADNNDKLTTWHKGSLNKNLITLLKRQEIELEQSKNKQDEAEIEQKTRLTQKLPFAKIEDVVWWIDNETQDERIEAIARGLSLVKPKRLETERNNNLKGFVPLTYALLAIAHHRTFKKKAFEKVFGTTILKDNVDLPRIPALLTRLAAGDCFTATKLAARRLRASGFPTKVGEQQEEESRTQRIAAALAFPLSDYGIAYLAKQVLLIHSKE
ncbi:type I-U CRISPR-associated protein Csx17 [Planktothrix sp. FACHB-1355]|uniref:Type I-U CRISPR-associated protein Csx17 n=1 Tax=Aerosakkonema funiforme FACHB-1375 TaxID=2949571 RepID=A0A926VB41_9CYAN|nr:MULTISPECIES: type I-U CRISPR-associated protein Csx17 [Oscillatoriales]MBD2180604.1 type I-U CRISPR-associated protein Csx17 [Aerosakkonema funiforme FACHB-1375]MBD3557636.1 type I-U CRISPR-associated protein Csx17 [Planktothrix sp. FACHB-1355]